MAAKTKPEVESQPEAAPGAIVVTGPEHGRWRAGRYFCAVARTLSLSELTPEDLAAIEDDPLLRSKRVS